MRFIHTADWHLGRQLYTQPLLDDQEFALLQLIELVEEHRPDALIVAGDLYDRAVPPAEAVALLDRTLSRIILDLGVPVLVVAGNHDSPDRVGFASAVLDAGGLHMAGRLEAQPRSVVLGEGDDVTRVWLLPYADPIETRHALGDESVHDHQDAVRCCLERIRACEAAEPRQVLVTHHFIGGGIVSESERGLTVGGTGAVGAELFDGFDYVALGHLHRPQSIHDARLHYSGSLFKYSFDEAVQPKSVSIVDLTDEGLTVTPVPLVPRRDVRRIEGTLADVLTGAAADDARDDYVEIVLDEPVMPPDAAGRARELYPNMLRIARKVELLEPDGHAEPGPTSVEKLTDEVLFERFFEYATGEQLAAEEHAVLLELLAERERSMRGE